MNTKKYKKQTYQRMMLTLGMVLIIAIVNLIPIQQVYAANPPIQQTYYVTLPEDDLLQLFDDDDAAGGTFPDPVSPIRSITSISIAATGTWVYYDHWEPDSGSTPAYEADLANPADLHSASNPNGTQIWGDGVLSNGCPPSINNVPNPCLVATDDRLDNGDVIILDNEVEITGSSGSYARNSAQVFFDGRDKFGASFPVAVTRGAFPISPGSVMAGGTEVLDTGRWGTSYESPLGEDSVDTNTNAFEDVRWFVMAGSGGATINVDANDDGDLLDANDLNGVVLSEGQVRVVDGIREGATLNVTSGSAVQINLMLADVNDTFEFRWGALLPRGDWTSDYYTPVGTWRDPSTNRGCTEVEIYNPNASSITVNYDFPGGSSPDGTFTVPAGSTATGQTTPATPIVPKDNGARFWTTGGQEFLPFSVTDCTRDTSGTDGRLHDWGNPIFPSDQLTDQVLVGWAPGCSNESLDGICEDPDDDVTYEFSRSVVWVTPLANTTFYVDTDGSGITCPGGTGAEQTIPANALESVRIVDDPTSANKVRDNFSSVSYSNNNGNVNWSTSWIETGDNNSANSGSILITGGTLRITGTSSAGDTIERQVNLSGQIFADLTFALTSSGNLESNDELAVEISDNGGSTWRKLATYKDDPTTTVKAIIISTYNASNTRIRFRQVNALASDEYWNIDQVQIKYASDGDYDMTGSRIVTCNGTTFAAAWGQDPERSDGNDDEALDLGTSIAPFGSAITIEKSGDKTQVAVGGPVVYTYEVRNIGSATVGLAGVTVTDNKCSPAVYVSGDTNTDDLLQTTEVWTFTCTSNIFVDTTNVAYASSTTPSLESAPDEWTVTVIQPAVIGNYVWLDEDGDGDQDAGEAGIPNMKVELCADETCTTVVETTYTDANGGYLFDGLSPGTYYVKTTPNASLNATYDEDGTGTPNISVVTVAAGDEHMTADFGYNWSTPGQTNTNTGTGAIGDRVWIDADGDGYQDPGEAGLGGVTVTLYTDDDGDGVYDDVYGTTTTDDAGNYIFDNLPPDSYVVEATPPAGYSQTGDPDEILDNQTTSPIILGPGDVYVNADFGYNPTGDSSAIGDTVWFDLDADGVEDAGEWGIPGVTVALIKDDGDGIYEPGVDQIIATDITDENGQYLFPDLPAGSYFVAVTDTENVLGEVSPTYDADGGLNERSFVTVNGVDDNLLQDFGYAPPGQEPGEGLIGDQIWLDRDGGGDFDPGEGLEGVRVVLTDPGADGILGTSDDTQRDTTTDENGNYYFGNLEPSLSYGVTVDTATLPAGVTNTIDPDGTTDSTTVRNLSVTGPVDLDADFAYRILDDPNTIGGTIWEDTDTDGTLTEGGRFEGVTVVLYDSNGNIVATTTTDSNGDYSFTGLPDGTYTVDVTDDFNVLNGYWHSDGPNDGDDNNSQDDPYMVSVSGGETNTTADFGYYILPAAASNFVFYDSDWDGIQDAGEPGIPGVEVTLTITYPDGTVTTVTTVTDENGYYSFDNLLLDEDYDGVGTYGFGGSEPQYSITVDTPDGYLPSPINQGGDDAVDSDDGSAGEQTQPVMGEEDDTNDFGFYGYEDTDFGDALDANYLTTRAVDGPGNILYPDTNSDGNPDTYNGDPAIWLGLLIDSEPDGQPTSTANGDDANGTLTDEDGVDLVSPTGWFEGTDGGTISVDLHSSEATTNSGYLMAWFDWNNDGAFDPSELVVGETVNWTGTTDTQQFTFDIPTGGLSSDVVYRVRLFDSEPANLDTAMTGLSVNGEVEDYYAPVESLPVTMNYFLASRQGNTLVVDWSTGSEMGNLGFNLLYQTDAGLQKLNADLIPATGVSTHVPQDYHVEIKNFDWDAEGVFFLQDVDFFGRMKSHGPFALGEVNGKRTQAEATDWEAIAAENETLELEREAENLSMINSQLDAWQDQMEGVEDVPNIQDNLNGETDPYQYYLPLFMGGEGVEPPPQDAVEVGDLLVDQTGIYRVTYEDLLAAGLDLGGQQASDIALMSGGSPVPIRVGGGSTFGAGSTLEFYGEALNTLYTTTNVYTLWIDPEKAQRISEDDTPYNDGLTPASYYMETERVDLNQVYEPVAAWSDPWFNEQMIVTSTTTGWDFPLSVDHYITGAAPAELTVGTYAGSDFRNGLPDHHYLLDFNGYPVADQLLDGAGIDIVESTLDAGQVVEGQNTLTVTLVADTGQDADIVYLDAYSLSYPRAFWARDGILSFASSGSAFQVDNLLDSAIEVYRLQNGTLTRINDLMVMDQGGSFRVRFNGSGSEAVYYVVSGSGLMSPEIQTARTAADITQGSAEYLVISHPNFIDGLAPLVSARSAQGLAVKVVDVFDIYDQFSYGVFDPGAIQDYIEFAWQNLGTQYVLLVGDDTYDYHGYQGNGAISFIPSLYAPAGDFVQYTPVDPKYVDFDGDNIPDLPIGRFAVRTAGEVDNMVSKTLSYDAKSYLRTSVFTADNQYADESDALIVRLPDDWIFDRAYLDLIGAEAANQALIDQINDGVSLTSYVGHSDDWEWTWDGLFDINDWAALINTGQPTLMVQNGCWNVYYLQSDYETLSDMMLNKGLTGAAAMFGSTTLTSDFNEQRFGEYFFPLLTQPGMTIGDAMTLAKAMLAAEDINASDVLIGWTLLGDPYLMVVP